MRLCPAARSSLYMASKRTLKRRKQRHRAPTRRFSPVENALFTLVARETMEILVKQLTVVRLINREYK